MKLRCYSIDPAEQTIYEEHLANDFYNDSALESFLHMHFSNSNIHFKDDAYGYPTFNLKRG
jgi:hypothetical protein